MKEYIERTALIRYAEKQEVIIKDGTSIADAMRIQGNVFRKCVETCPTVDAVEVDKVAEMFRIMFADDCACNYNGNDEWLHEKCQYAQTDCPMPKERLGCWKEFVKHFSAKMDGDTK